jgi:hypothetical protein
MTTTSTQSLGRQDRDENLDRNNRAPVTAPWGGSEDEKIQLA